MMLCFSLAQAFTPGFTNSVFYFRPHLWGFLQSLQRSAKACFKTSWKEAGSTFRPAFPGVKTPGLEKRVFLGSLESFIVIDSHENELDGRAV